MAEIKTGIFAKNVQKRLSRAQEKVLQKLGKADETKDEQFEQCVQNFKRQESEGSRLQREMKAYLAAVKGMQQASMNLTESLHEVYEPDWYGKDDVMIIGKNCDALWEDFHQKLVDSSLITLDTYLAQFPDIKNRVAKRSRKLIDYDSARHHLETLQASTIRNERKISKAEEEFQKAQKVFDELNIDLQEELPSLWDSRVGFYVNTFKNVTNLESKFHREISSLCHKLYEVMTKLGEQHSDKMFTIQGAPSDSGPLRLARTPSPPEDESPPGSPEAGPNNLLRPTSPGPPRPKSPSQLKKGPPVPPPPKVTPTKELHQEQIISLFDDHFVPEINVTTPSQKEAASESLLDLDFDPFKPDATTPIGQTQSPISQTLPWDLWTAVPTASAEPGAASSSFTADWSADFNTPSAAPGENGEQNQGAPPPASQAEPEPVGSVVEFSEDPFAGQGEEQGWPPADGWETTEVRSWHLEQNSTPDPNTEPGAAGSNEAEPGVGWGAWPGGGDQRMPGIIFTNEFGQEIEDSTEGSQQGLFLVQDGLDSRSGAWRPASQDIDGLGSEYDTTEEWVQEQAECSSSGEPQAVAAVGGGLMNQQGEDEDEEEVKGGITDWSTQCQGEGQADGPPSEEAQEEGPHTGPVSISHTDPFGQQGGNSGLASGETLEFVSDPFAEPPGDAGSGWAADPFSDDKNQMWPKGWGPATASETWGFPDSTQGQANGFAQWSAFPEPAANEEGADNGSPWQEVGDSSGFFSTDSQGDFGSSWGGSESREEDPFSTPTGGGGDKGESGLVGPAKSCPTIPEPQFDVRSSRNSSIGSASSQKDNENNNSDLSEDEVANRRYARLYQEVDPDKEETDSGTPLPADSKQGVSDAMPEAETAAASETEAAPAEPQPDAAQVAEAPAPVETSPPAEKEADIPEVEAQVPVVSPEAEPSEIPPSAPAENNTPSEATLATEPPSELPLEMAQTMESEEGSRPTEALSVASPLEEEREKDSSEDAEAKEEKMPIPSVVIEPASSNEGDDDRDGDITSPGGTTDNSVTPDGQSSRDLGAVAAGDQPLDFLYKVETLHDFEAANSDELDLKRGDIVLVIPTEAAEDQDAGWLTGIKESDWLQQGSSAMKGLFPENFVQRIE